MIQIFPDKNHFLVKISQGKLYVMACQGIETDGKKLKTEINKNIKIMNHSLDYLYQLLIYVWEEEKQISLYKPN